MIQNEFETLIADAAKKIVSDIAWGEDEDHSRPSARPSHE